MNPFYETRTVCYGSWTGNRLQTSDLIATVKRQDPSARDIKLISLSLYCVTAQGRGVTTTARYLNDVLPAPVYPGQRCEHNVVRYENPKPGARIIRGSLLLWLDKDGTLHRQYNDPGQWELYGQFRVTFRVPRFRLIGWLQSLFTPARKESLA